MFEIWRSPRELEAYEWLDLEINNLRVAFRWAMDNQEVDVAARIASDVGDVGRFRLREEAAFWAEEIVDQAREVQHPRLAVLLTWCASSAWAFSRFDDAQRFGDEALALRDDPDYDPFIWAYGDLAFVALFQGDIDRALELIKAGGEHPTDRVDRFMLAFHLYLLATTGRTEQALAIADDVVQKAASAGVPMSIAVAYGGKGAALEPTDPTAALAFYERSVDVSRESGNRFMEALIAPRIAALHARSGEPRAALQGFERMLASFGEATDIASVSAWRAALVVLLAKLGHFEAAATLHGTFAALIDAKGVFREHPEAVEQVREALGDDAFSEATARGAAMSLREASNYAVEQVQRGLKTLEQAVEA
jgi:tetratricopeptide (TPR) repeat protein